MFMPTLLGKQILDTKRQNHEGGHRAYNLYVKHELDDIYKNTDVSQQLGRVRNLTLHLRAQLRDGNDNLPWK